MNILKKCIQLFSTSLVYYQTGANSKGKVRANFPCKLTKKCFFGKNVNFNGIKVYGDGEVRFGNNFHSGKNVKFITSFHNYDKGMKIPYDDTFITKNIIIEDNVWIGNNVIVLGGVKICEGAVIQAGSVVVSNINYCSVVGGAPAKEFKKRDIEHYENLKDKSMFF